MRAILVVWITAAACLASLGSPAIANAGPPPGLSAYGRLVWNFEALAKDYYGTSSVCRKPGSYDDFSITACGGGTSGIAGIRFYFPVFAKARRSEFKLTGRPPDFTSNIAAVMLGSGYILCSPGRWLAYTQTGEWLCASR